MASEVDAAVTVVLTVTGARAREVNFVMPPADRHQICRLLAAVKDTMPNSRPNDPQGLYGVYGISARDCAGILPRYCQENVSLA